MCGFASFPYASMEIGSAAVPEPAGASTPVQVRPRRSSSRSPSSYAREALVRVRHAMPLFVPEAWSLPGRLSGDGRT
ncbi:hypothetical protein ACWD62_30905 [Streptomyces sp. NPDC005146]